MEATLFGGIHIIVAAASENPLQGRKDKVSSNVKLIGGVSGSYKTVVPSSLFIALPINCLPSYYGRLECANGFLGICNIYAPRDCKRSGGKWLVVEMVGMWGVPLTAVQSLIIRRHCETSKDL